MFWNDIIYDIIYDVCLYFIVTSPFDQWLAWTTIRASCAARTLGVCWEFCLFSRRRLAPILTRIGSDSVVSICIIGLWIQSSPRSMSCAKLRDTTAGQTSWSVLDVLSGTSSAWMGWRSQRQRSATPRSAPVANVQRMSCHGQTSCILSEALLRSVLVSIRRVQSSWTVMGASSSDALGRCAISYMISYMTLYMISYMTIVWYHVLYPIWYHVWYHIWYHYYHITIV